MTLYWSAIALSCTIVELFDAQNIETLKSRLGVTQAHWKWHHSIDRIRVPIRPHCNYGRVLYHFRNKLIVEKRQFS